MTRPSSSNRPRPAPAAEIRLLDRPAEMSAVIEVLGLIWESTTPIATVELLRSLAHGGGYVAGAYVDGALVGASFGFLTRHEGRPTLHSHVTGIVEQARHLGIGRQIKDHQRRWAAEHEIGLVSWTFDPLVRRNAWFNIAVLGAEATDYHVDFYGPMGDSLNRGDDSDRLFVVWPTATPASPTRRVGADSDDRRRRPATIAIATPEDIIALRQSDPASARSWRLELRRLLTAALGAGGRITGFTPAGDYLITPTTGSDRPRPEEDDDA